MPKNSFVEVAATKSNQDWDKLTKRVNNLYHRDDDIRSVFARDYTRILHCTAYRRLKHKTQVFFATQNDHICTRIEHVNHVASVSHTIAQYLGLNTELTNAIAIGHDLGHAPFGHAGEKIVANLANKWTDNKFWHEKNSLRYVDEIETLLDNQGYSQNMNLSYAVRDGIICHCGEVDQNGIKPRSEAIDLLTMTKPNQHQPYSWEACVVKVSDKIAYLGRDIEDAISLGILTLSELKKLRKIANSKIKDINNTVIMHDLIINLCENSDPCRGIFFSCEHLKMMNEIKKFNYETIYQHPRIENYKRLVDLVINSIFEVVKGFYRGVDTTREVKYHDKFYPELSKDFYGWLLKYSNVNERSISGNRLRNKIIYDLNKEADYCQAIIDYISGMSDQYALRIFRELTSF